MIGVWGGLWHGAPYVCFALEGRIIQGFGSVGRSVGRSEGGVRGGLVEECWTRGGGKSGDSAMLVVEAWLVVNLSEAGGKAVGEMLAVGRKV